MYGHAYKIYQQSHKSAPTADRMNVSMCIIGTYRWPDYFVNVHKSHCSSHGTERPAPVALTRERYCTDRKPVSGRRWDRPAGETPARHSHGTTFPSEPQQSG